MLLQEIYQGAKLIIAVFAVKPMFFEISTKKPKACPF